MMIKYVISISLVLLLIGTGCKREYPVDGPECERQVLLINDLYKDHSYDSTLNNIIDRINCADSTIFSKRLKLAEHFHSGDTSEILVIPYNTKQESFSSEGFSDLKHRVIFLNIKSIRDFSLLNSLSGDKSVSSVTELVILHEIGHFRLGKEGSFDKSKGSVNQNLERPGYDDSQPEYLTVLKRIELNADSLAIDILQRRLKLMGSCTEVCFDLELLLPGMQFNMFGNGIPQNWFKGTTVFLHDPSSDYPNMELRIMFMNYFLFPTPERGQQIDDYLYNRTVAPVHRQEFNPKIYQGSQKQI